MGLAIKATFKWADEMDSLQDIMGGTNKSAAALNFVLRKSGTDTAALTKGMTILEKGLIKADGSLDTVGKGLKAWGINVLDANGMLKDQTALLGDISERYSQFSTQQEKVNFLTETFGRSGAELIDFFDTLAAEGGIDTVAAKVERLGLAIDPNRYEQFNRNLEELKLVGLGLAVGFTEKVMPVIEKFLELVSNPKGVDVSKILAWADTTIGVFVKGIGDSINNWVSGGGPEEFSENLISWIEGIGDSDSAKSKTQIAMEHLVKAMGEALSKIDFSGIAEAFFAALNRTFATKGDEWSNRNRQVVENSLTLEGNEWANRNAPAVNAFFAAIHARLTAAGSSWANRNREVVQNSFTLKGDEWANRNRPEVDKMMSTLGNDIRQKLDTISQTFYSKAQSWINQAVQGFQASKGRLLAEIQTIVGLVNGILRKIMTTFTITVKMPEMPSWMPGGGGNKPKPPVNSTGGGTSWSQGEKDYIPKAGGGPVRGGMPYLVGEMGPEMFVPGSNGNIVPNNALGQSVTARLDDAQLRMLAVLIGESVIKGLNSA